uniref:Protein kinase domain-containing protein n=1 Tax=Oryzias latipes TaxID=8090 RepID=A0A3B3I3E1_ORYLA
MVSALCWSFHWFDHYDQFSSGDNAQVVCSGSVTRPELQECHSVLPVARCTKLGSPEIYAIKIITNVQEGKEEFESMKLIQVLDPDENHLMKMYECFSFQNVICLVYEILEESLEDFLIKNECKQMFQALKALKSIGVVHCDIKLDNIMFADKNSLKFKLIDFGLAVESKELPIGTEIQVTRFRAPEVILGLPLDESVDMWALGMVLACVYFGNYPFPSRTEYETIRAMVQIFGLPEADVLNRQLLLALPKSSLL